MALVYRLIKNQTQPPLTFFKTPFHFTITAPNTETVLSNGPLISAEAAGIENLTVHKFGVTQPLPTYLVALAVGPYEVMEADALPATSIRSEPIPFRGFAPVGKAPKLADAIASTPSGRIRRIDSGAIHGFGPTEVLVSY